jgi:hypothetical protein
MASNVPIPREIQRLIQTGNTARNVLGSEIRAFKHKLDVPARVKESLTSHPTGWLGGSLVAGMAGSLLFRRKAKREKLKKKTFWGFVLSLVIASFRPLIKVWLAGQLKNYVTAKFEQDEIPSRPNRRVKPFYQ